MLKEDYLCYLEREDNRTHNPIYDFFQSKASSKAVNNYDVGLVMYIIM